MLAPFPEILADRRARRAAAGAFTSYDLETATAVLAAAKAAGAPVILLISREAFAAPGGDALVTALRAIAERAPVACCLQLDHVADLGLMERALELGCGALMADGSRLPLGENAELVARAVALATARGAHVEAELGHVAGDEEVARAAAAGALTDPADAARFVEETGAACLAVSIGNAHGIYREPPRLDWARLEAVRAATPVPLSLHGASGIPEADVRRAIALGIAKVNVNVELRAAYLAASEPRDVQDGLRLLELHDRQREAVRAVAAAKLASYELQLEEESA
jgi:ketose-bisphosphate aldolase